MKSCSETTTPEPKVVIPKHTFTMTVDGVAWAVDSTVLIYSFASMEYGNDKGVIGNLTDDSRCSGEFNIVI